MAIVRLLAGRAEFVDVTIMEDNGRYPVTLPADDEEVDYLVDVEVRPARGNFPATLGIRVIGLAGAAVANVFDNPRGKPSAVPAAG